jgi:hypothetical protein
MSQIKVLLSAEKLNESLVDGFRTVLDSRPADQFLHVGLSGGSIIPLLISLLRHLHGTSLSRFRFYFCDERLVPIDDVESTYGQYVKAIQQSGLSVQIEQFVRVNEAYSTQDAADDYVRTLPYGDLGPHSHALNQSFLFFLFCVTVCSSSSECADRIQRNSRIRSAAARNGTGRPHLFSVPGTRSSQRTRSFGGRHR